MSQLPLKTCTSCKNPKQLECFGKNKSQPDGYHYYCKDCVINMREKNRDKDKEYFKNYREQNRDELNAYHRDYRNKYKDDILPAAKKNSKKHMTPEEEKLSHEKKLEARRIYLKNKYANDQQYRLKKKFEATLNRLLTEGDRSVKAPALIGCSVVEYRAYLESKFVATMSWLNYGEAWSIDRIIPFCDFDLANKEDALKCFHYSNSQPLFIRTTVIDGVEYIGNANKNKFSDITNRLKGYP